MKTRSDFYQVFCCNIEEKPKQKTNTFVSVTNFPEKECYMNARFLEVIDLLHFLKLFCLVMVYVCIRIFNVCVCVQHTCMDRCALTSAQI